MGVIVGAAVLGDAIAALFARLCDVAMEAHTRLYALAPWATLVLLPVGFARATWLTRRFGCFYTVWTQSSPCLLATPKV
jgi:hypothetical protein